MVLRSVPAPPPLGFELLGLAMCLPAVFALGGYLRGRGRALPLSCRPVSDPGTCFLLNWPEGSFCPTLFEISFLKLRQEKLKLASLPVLP